MQSANAVLNEKNEEIQQQTEEIQAQNDLLEAINEEINLKNQSFTDSIEYAKSIQFAMLPAKEDLDEIFDGYFVMFIPRDIVSGDFYWAYDLGDKILWAAGDCTGHGVPGAFMSLISMSLLNEVVIENRLSDPAQILGMLREQIISRLDANKNSNRKDGLDLSLCVLDKATLKMTYSGAYNPMVIYNGEELVEIKGDRMPVGKHVLMDNFTNQEIDLKKGDIVYTFSDGYIDQLGGAKRKKYSKHRMYKLSESIAKEPLQKQMIKLESDFEERKDSHDQLDDIVVLGVRI